MQECRVSTCRKSVDLFVKVDAVSLHEYGVWTLWYCTACSQELQYTQILLLQRAAESAKAAPS